MKKITILGSTGSIGVNTLRVVEDNPDRYSVFALGAGGNMDLLARQIVRFSPAVVAVKDSASAGKLSELIPGRTPEVLTGERGYRQISSLEEINTVVSAMSGAAGLLPTLEALRAGKDVALANKETVVMAGPVVIGEAARRGARLLPVDSEHSAILQCLQGHDRNDLRRVVLTASGGPFREADARTLAAVTPAQALRHPNWSMGPKISIDSATLMNKGLEVIEAKWFFDLEPGQIDVIIHPESIVHSMVEYCDGSVIAQMGVPDMRVAISYALSFPRHTANDLPRLDLEKTGTLNFHPPDLELFPCLRLALEALKAGGTAPAILNAANEVAVAAFLEERIAFTDIARVITEVLNRQSPVPAANIETVLEADSLARRAAGEVIIKAGH